MKLINLSVTSIWILFSLLTVTCGAAYAQETGQKARQRPELLPVGQEEMDTYEKLLRDADALVRSGKAAVAFDLLAPFEFEHAGEVRFDHLIGIAALDSGKPDKATLAFERVLAVNPDFPAVRFDMGRAYFQLGDLPRARSEFVMALKQSPTEKARVSIDKYLNEIAVREAGKKTQITGYVEATVGHDSNVNNSTSQSQVQIFDGTIWTSIPLNPTNVKSSDNYYGMAAGGAVAIRQNSSWILYAGADLNQRGNRTQKYVDSLGLNARAGVMVGEKIDRLRFEMFGGRYALEGSPNYDSTGFNVDWRHLYSPGNQLSLFSQYVQYRFADMLMQPNDINQKTVGFGWLHILADGKSTFSGSLHYGTEKDVAPIIAVSGYATPVINPSGGRNDGAKRFKGVRAGVRAFINNSTELFANAGVQLGDYGKINYLFLRQRHDRFYDLKFGAVWRWDKLWALRPQLSFFRNDSNIAIYSYDRMDVSMSVRREFR